MTIAPNPPTAPVTGAVLTREHLLAGCDRCTANAFVAIRIALAPDATGSGVLTFCAHHFAEVEPALIGRISDLLDNRDALLARP